MIKKVFKDSFNSIVVEKKEKSFVIKLTSSSLRELFSGEVLIKVLYSSINYKDMMIAEGNPGLVRKYPHIPGIDVAGTVEISNSKKFLIGDEVIVIARPFGINEHGGFAEYTKVPDKWLEKLPDGLTSKEAIIFGTAGFTAALSLYKYEQYINKNNLSSILVTGGTGGVALCSIYLFNKKGYKVHALTSQKSSSNNLKNLGAEEVLLLNDFLKNSKFPLLKKKYSGIIDSLGGEVLSIASSQVNDSGILCVIGNVRSNKSDLSLLPFILRGIHFVGINAESINNAKRKKIWKMIANLKDNILPEILYNECTLKDVRKHLSKTQKNKNFGRTIVKLA